ncbi:MAG: CBS domain-containing protein [Acidobacteria bacterium]|nr:CBS domain-containing protein [Acidobacteriota bacterium]
MVPRPRVHGIEADTPLDEVVRIVAESPYTRLPVYRGTLDRVVGILHTHDLALLQLRTGSRPGLDQILRPVVTVSETLSADRLLKLFRERRTHQAIVVNEHGATAGLVTLEDVLAELLGDVADELKPAPPREGART